MAERKNNRFSEFYDRFFRGVPKREPPAVPATENIVDFGEPAANPEVWNQEEMDRLRHPQHRAGLNAAALACIEQNDISQTEVEFIRSSELAHRQDGTYDLRLLADTELFGADAGLFAPYADREQMIHGDYRLATALGDVLSSMGTCRVSDVDYTDPQQIREQIPEILRNGLKALTLLKVVQGPLREQVNGYIALKDGIDNEEASQRWKQLNVLAGERNTAIDILKYYASDHFISRDKEPDMVTDVEHRQLSECCCAIHFQKEPLYRQFVGAEIRQLNPEQVAYLGSGGDHRAFYDIRESELNDFMDGRSTGVRVIHRSDYLGVIKNAGHTLAAEDVRKKVGFEQLSTKRGLQNEESDKKDNALQSGSRSRSALAGRSAVNADKKSSGGPRIR